MTEHVIMTLIICGTAFSAVLSLMMTITDGKKSNFESLVEAWRERNQAALEVKKAEIELKKIQAQHERVCPRLTDRPRGT